MKRIQTSTFLIFGFGILSLTSAVYAQPTGHPISMIREGIDETTLVTLEGNTRPEANAVNDRGAVSDDFPLNHMLLQLKRSPEREAALEQFVDELHDSNSPNFHKWLTPAQFAEHYGVAHEDVDTVTVWLKSRGFTVHGVQPNGLMIDFSGTAGQVRGAYHTEIHNLEVNGTSHFANMSDPRIPRALEPALAGIVSLHNFHPAPQLVPRGYYTFTNAGATQHALVAGDLATIYNLNPVFAAGLTGKGQTIMVVEDTYLFSTADWTTFRQTFGLASKYPFGSLSQVSPQGSINCANPGFQGRPKDPGYGDDSEAAIDVEWASAAAPNAAIVLAACTDTTTTFGGLIAIENVIDGPFQNLPSVISVSYGESEAQNGATANLAYALAYQQAVAEGVSIFVSSGDENGASADNGNVAKHGTYIQEIPWNNSCAGGLVAAFVGLTPLGLCNSAAVTSPTGALNILQNSVGGSGGPSGCATGTPAKAGVVGGSCAGYPKPFWQFGIAGNPNDGVRDIPDVSLFASNGFWDAYYVVCWSNPDLKAGGGSTCSGPPSTWAGFGGTSVSSPILAGIQALIDQRAHGRQGNPNPVYYALAQAEYGFVGGQAAACNSNTVNKTANRCIFYDVTQGDNVGVCEPNKAGTLNNCFLPAGDTFGVLSTSNATDRPAFTTNVGWDFASGIGSVNGFNLVMNWPVFP